jgi:MFS family permease
MMSEYKQVINNPKFVYLWLSQLLSQLTINVTNFLLLLKLFSLTGSTIATSFLWISYALPVILVGPLAAATVDMFDRRITLMLTNLLQSSTIFFYAILRNPSIFLVYGLAMAYSFLNQFYVPAEAASLPSVVPRKHLPHANGIFFLTQQACLAVGFSVAGVLNHFLGFSTSLFIGAGLLLIAFVSVAFLPSLKPTRALPKNVEAGLKDFFNRLLEGYELIKNNRLLLSPLLLLLGLQICLTMVAVNVPKLVQDVMGLAASVGMVYIAISAGLGAATGALVITRLVRAGWRKKRMIDNFLLAAGISIFVFIFNSKVFLGPLSMPISFTAIFFLALSFIGIVIPAQTFLQEKVPGGFRGRVFGNYWFLATILTIFPVIFAGTIAELFGIRLMLFLIATLAVGLSLVSRRWGQNYIEKGVEGGI